ncbi:MAG: hypothetical protein ACUZ8O_17615 [Candidatus Anammoxibacter sp.]
MSQILIDEERLKDVFKEAVIEAIEQRKDLIHDIVSDAIEDIAMTNAIKEGENTESVGKDEIYDILED